MLNKAVCFECHMKYYGVDGTDRSIVKCHPPPNSTDRKQCEEKFNSEWDRDEVWCFGIANNATEKECDEMFGKEKSNCPIFNPKTHVASKFCDYRSEQPKT